jgi:hypothetical protein
MAHDKLAEAIVREIPAPYIGRFLDSFQKIKLANANGNGDRAVVKDYAEVYGQAYGDAVVQDRAVVYGQIYGSATASDHEVVYGSKDH